MFLTALYVRHKAYMNEKAVFLADFKRYLSDSLQKRLAFYISDSTAYFRDDDIRPRRIAERIDEVLYFICDMRYHLYRFTEINASTFFFDYIGIYSACREVGEFIKVFVNKSLIVT